MVKVLVVSMVKFLPSQSNLSILMIASVGRCCICITLPCTPKSYIVQ